MTTADPVLEDEFVAAVGRLTLSWPMVEAGLDFCILAIYRHHDGAAIEPEPPRMLERKLAFLKTAFKRGPKFEARRADLLALLSAIGQASDFRHDVIHGFAVNGLEGNPTTAHMVRILRETEGYRMKPIALSADKINQEAVKVNGLAIPLGKLSKILLSST